MTATSTETAVQPVHRIAKELVASSGFLLARLGLSFKSKAIAQIEHQGFEAHHYSVLAMLGEGVRETQATIANTLDLDPSRLVAVLDSLEERGLITRQRDPQDRRRHVVRITPAGKQQLQKLRSITILRTRPSVVQKVTCCPKRHLKMPFCRVYKRMMGLEPTTFCMASARDVRARSRPGAQTACSSGLRSSERTRANPSERRTLPFLPRVEPDRRP
jgi:DNA-binding MarR family transcriptional regulator